MPEEEKEQQKPEQEDRKKGSILPWALTLIIVAVFAAAGFFVGNMLKGQRVISTAGASTEDTEAPADSTEPGTESGDTWFHTLEAVVANLDDPGVTRYVRVALTLEFLSTAKEDKTIKLVEDKKPIITNWLTIYLSSLGIEDVRGDKNLKRIQAQILEAFNQQLFPDSKPQIKQILFKEFAIQ